MYMYMNKNPPRSSKNALERCKTTRCHWRELPHVSFLSRQNTSFAATKVCLPRQNFYRDKIMFAGTKVLTRQKWYLWQLPPVITRNIHILEPLLPCCARGGLTALYRAGRRGGGRRKTHFVDSPAEVSILSNRLSRPTGTIRRRTWLLTVPAVRKL